jgi:hypothetical protein
MTLSRRIHGHVSWKHLVVEGCSWYALTFVVFFLKLHFIGFREWVPSYHREYLPVKDSIVQARVWAFIGPALWLLHDYVLQGSELWRSFSGLDYPMQRLVVAGLVGMVTFTVLAWQIMLPFWGLAAAIAFYLRFSRPKDSL